MLLLVARLVMAAPLVLGSSMMEAPGALAPDPTTALQGNNIDALQGDNIEQEAASLLGGKKILFVGDSPMRQDASGLICLLHALQQGKTFDLSGGQCDFSGFGSFKQLEGMVGEGSYSFDKHEKSLEPKACGEQQGGCTASDSGHFRAVVAGVTIDYLWVRSYNDVIDFFSAEDTYDCPAGKLAYRPCHLEQVKSKIQEADLIYTTVQGSSTKSDSRWGKDFLDDPKDVLKSLETIRDKTQKGVIIRSFQAEDIGKVHKMYPGRMLWGGPDHSNDLYSKLFEEEKTRIDKIRSETGRKDFLLADVLSMTKEGTKTTKMETDDGGVHVQKHEHRLALIREFLNKVKALNANAV